MNELVMIDSSCWIEYLRNSDQKIADTVVDLIQNHQACICGIIEMEIVQGIRNKKQAELVSNLFDILKYYTIVREDFINAGKRIIEMKKKGIIVATSDCLIAEICIKNNLKLYTKDKDFNYFQKLKLY